MPPTLNPGDTGLAASEAQYLLARYIQEPTAIDGVFGPTTEAAVQDYQQKFGLTVTGVVNHPTWVGLDRAPNSRPASSSGHTVRWCTDCSARSTS